MRLLRVSDFKLQSFVDEECPPYAILSHTWGREEISLQELQLAKTISLLYSTRDWLAKEIICDGLHYPQGCLKIAGCALQAERDSFDYIWCDTCCIDKTNSTELSEAINSMYNWYRGRLCYVYLADISVSDLSNPDELDVVFSFSRWFTRGWTLQELIAPSKVVFFDANWQAMGTRSEYRDKIAKRTGIDREVLDGKDPLGFSVANRMSWASQRQTTRVEDLAYCLMGLFGVNMPLIYGEKHKAFLRLQTEIMKVSEDHSLFAWRDLQMVDDPRLGCGLLATSPRFFTGSRTVVPSNLAHTSEEHPPFSMTSRGVNISLPLIPIEKERYNIKGSAALFFAIIDCLDITNTKGPLGVYLIRLPGRALRRCFNDRLDFASEVKGCCGEITTKLVYVAQHEDTRKIEAQRADNVHIPELSEEISRQGALLKVFTDPKQREYDFYIPELPEEISRQGAMLKVFTDPGNKHASWDSLQRRLRFTGGLAAALYIGRHDSQGRMLVIGLDTKLHARGVFREGNAFPRGITIDTVTKQDYRGVELATFYEEYWGQLRSTFDDDDRPSTTLDIGSWTKMERRNAKFYQRHFEHVHSVCRLHIDTAIKESIIHGQRTFTLNIELVRTTYHSSRAHRE